MSIAESEVEEAAIEYFKAIGYEYLPGPTIAPGEEGAERKNWQDVILEDRLRSALRKINLQLDSNILDDAANKLLRPPTASMEDNNLAFHRVLTKGIQVQVREEGNLRGDFVWAIDFEDPSNNDWLVVNQLTVVGGKETRRPDIVVYVNGLPLAVIELKNPEDVNATIESAWNQLQTYKSDIPQLFDTNELLIISDGVEARVGSLTAGFERFGPWRTVVGQDLAPDSVPKLKVLIEGLFDKERLLEYLRHFIFCETQDGFVKKVAGYHQFWAVQKAVQATLKAAGEQGDRRVGVVWHTQGSGKSVSMVFYAGKIILEEAMANPTLVVLTDRNDLDGQLHGQFAAAPDLIPQPVQAESRDHLRELLHVASGGVVFTTMQKFGTGKGERMPQLSDRRNIIVIADEAHRSHYAFVEGFARNLRDALPHASFLGFTGTPIEFDDKSTPAVFGDYIDTYTISQAVEDGATVKIHYEARLAKIELPDEEKPRVDEDFEEVTEGEEAESKERLKTTWARLEALVGTEKRLGLIGKDIVEHWDRRTEILSGKAMIVCMSRRICVDLYKQIVALRPEWHSDEDDAGAIKVVMTGSASDDPDFQPHIRNKKRKKEIEKRFKDPDDPLQIVIVRDMWLTGFDVPCLHTLYLDKPMKGHTLMQAIARVNRVFRDKPAGLVVDYLGLADYLRKAVGHYGKRPDGKGGSDGDFDPGLAVRVLIEKFEIVKAMFHGFNCSGYFTTSASNRLETLTAAADHILSLNDGKKRYLDSMAALNKAAGIALHYEEARYMRDEIGFFQGVESNIRKYAVTGSGKTKTELDAAIRQILSDAVASEGVIDIFAAAGLAKPDVSILSDEFLQTVKASPHKNLQIELLKKLLHDEINAQSRQNVVQARRFSELLERTLNSYQNRTLEVAQVILELIDLAKEMRDAPKRGDALGLTDDELAFYDALVAHGNVRDVMGDEVLAAIAHDLVDAIRGSVTIDWTKKESVRARMRSKVKRLLRQHGYPPDKQEAAVITVIDQAEVVCREWGEVA